MRYALAVAACCVPLISTAQAGPDAGQRGYLFVKLGSVLPQGSEMEARADGLAYEVGAGLVLAPHVALEAGGGHFALTFRKSGSDAYGRPWEYSEDVGVTPVFANLRLFARTNPVPGFVQGGGGYVVLGVGGYFMSADATTSGPGSGAVVLAGTGSDTAVAFQVGGGVALYFTRSVTLGFEAKYAMADATLFTLTRNINTVLLAGTLGCSF